MYSSLQVSGLLYFNLSSGFDGRNLGNNASFDSLMETMRVLAEDVSDPPNQKAAFNFLSRCVVIWAQPNPPRGSNGNTNRNPLNDMRLPGFERYIYERLIPTAFGVPSLPDLNLKDGQVTVVCLVSLYSGHCVDRVNSFSGFTRDRQLSTSRPQDSRTRSP